ncbi:MAG: CopG family transcriptional regulator [Actinomycetota bacterium]|nr:CopG family transcriptional regulator [Actinomycetota bacterium]
MVRTQVQLTEEQVEALKRLAGKKNVSIAELVRRGVDIVIQSEAEISGEELRQRAISAAGKFKSGKPDLSIKHDEYLAEALDS